MIGRTRGPWHTRRMDSTSQSARIVVLAGPSGVGKGTVVKQLKEWYPDLAVSVSATTRDPRPGEIDGVDYHFVTDEEFDRLIASGGLAEWALVHGLNRYGTPQAPLDAELARGHSVLVEIDLAGARQIRHSRPDAYLVFLAPPSMEELIARLSGRGTETFEEQQRRLATAREEMAARSEFDTTIVNTTVTHAARELAAILGLD